MEMEELKKLLGPLSDIAEVHNSTVIIDTIRVQTVEQRTYLQDFRKKFKRCIVKDPQKSSNKYPVYVVDMLCVQSLAQPPPDDEYVEVNFNEVCQKLEAYYADIESFKERVNRLCVALQANAHVALVGPPGSGKTHLLYALYDFVPGSVVLAGFSLTKAGVEDLLIERVPPLMLVDEFDKTDPKELSIFLPLLESKNKRLTIVKHNKRVEIDVSQMRLVVTMNVLGKRAEIWKFIKDRLETISFEYLSWDELKIIILKEVPNVSEEFLKELATYANKLSIRRAINLARISTISIEVARAFLKEAISKR